MNELKILFIKIFSYGFATGCLLTLFIGILFLFIKELLEWKSKKL